jgi:hypothetical protein
VEWKCISVHEQDHEVHAAKLQAALQELSDEGFNVTSMQQRGEAMLITASRFVEPASIPDTTSPPGDKAN